MVWRGNYRKTTEGGEGGGGGREANENWTEKNGSTRNNNLVLVDKERPDKDFGNGNTDSTMSSKTVRAVQTGEQTERPPDLPSLLP